MKLKLISLRFNTKTRIGLLIILLCMSGIAKGDVIIGDLKYQLHSITYTATVKGHKDGTNATGSLVIPSSVTYGNKTYSVTEINDGAFNGCTHLTGNLIIPNSVINIRNMAFYGCSGFTGNLTIGNSVTTIEEGAFCNCSGFTGSLIIPNSVTIIEHGAFQNCSGFTGNLTIGNSVTAIEAWAFWHCDGLTGNLIIPNSVTTIGARAFLCCGGLTGDLVIPNSVTIIEELTFYGCSGFTGNLTIPSSVSTINREAFRNCSHLSSMTVLAETPPSLGTDVFKNMNLNIPVMVPCGTINTYQYTMGWDVFTNYQNIQPCAFEVTVTANPLEGGTVAGSGIYDEGEICVVTAIPTSGYSFSNWMENGTVVSTNASYMFTVNGNRDLVANFTINTYNITVSTSPLTGGTAIGGGTYNHGASCTLTATPATGYTFVNWTKNGTQVSTNATHTFTVTESANYVAHFQIQSYTVSVSADPTNGGTVSGGGTFNYGQSCTIHATAATGYNFVNWTENGTQVSTNADYSFTVTDNRTLVAHFQQQSYSITVAANPTAGGTVSGAGTYNYGQSCTLTATANQGYSFVKWTKNGTQVSTNAVYTFTVTEAASYVAHFQIQSYTVSVVADPTSGGTVSGGGTFNYGHSCTVHATAAMGYNFVNWTENGTQVSTNADYTFTVTGNRNLVAYFSTQNYIITVAADPVEGGVVSGSGGYNYGDQCTLTATANPGYTFVNWTKNGTQVSTNVNYTFTVIESATYVAHFQIQSYTVSVSADPTAGGTVSGGGTYNHGQSCTLTATPATGYTFLNWTKNGTQVSTNASYTFTVTESAVYVAHFQLQTYTITATADPTAGGTVNGGGTYNHGQSCTLTATPATGYIFLNWTKNGTQVSTNVSYTFTVTESAAYVAHFQLQTYTITATADPTAGGTVSGGGTYNHGQGCTLTAAPATGYTFVNWTKNGTQVSTNASYTFTVTESAAYVAHFQLQTYTVAVTADPTNGGTVSGDGTFTHGQSCTVNATAASGYTFINWTENGSFVSSDASYTFTVTANRNLVANFTANPLPNYTIAVSANPTEGGTLIGGGTYQEGQSCTVSAMPNTNYTFVNWTENGSVVSTNASYTFTVTGNRTLVANFNYVPPTYIITITANPTDGGTITGGGTYQEGQSCTVSATPNTNYTFVNWTENGSVVSSNASYTFTVNSNRTLVANFNYVPPTYTITVTATPTDGGTVSGGGTYTQGETCTLNATPNTGFNFVNWTENGTQVSINATYSFTVNANRNLVANFTSQNYVISAVADPVDGGSITGAGGYNYGETCTLTATANEGYTFQRWTKDGTEVANTPSYSFTVTESATFMAHFIIQTYTITVIADPEEGGTFTGDGTYNYGEYFTITAIPNENYVFAYWIEDGVIISNSSTLAGVATSDKTYVAHFEYYDGMAEQDFVKVTLFPNPAKDKLTIETTEPISMIEIYNSYGALVYRQKDCTETMEISIDHYAIGTYILRLTTENKFVVRRFVKK